jgi:hypothetical protein
MKILLLLLLLPAPVFAQKAVEPIRVSLSSESENLKAPGAGFHALVRGELRKLRNLSFASSRPEFDIYLAVTELKEKGRFIGYTSATLVIENRNGRQKLHFDIATGPTLENLARHAVAKMVEDVFDRRRKE